MAERLTDETLDQLFRSARTRNGWLDRPVTDAQIRELYELLKFGPTSANGSPARFVWVRAQEGKAQLAKLVSDANRAKVLEAPLTVIIGSDPAFYEKMPQLFPARGEQMKAMFAENEPLAEATAFRNSSLQGAYLIVAARALGLDAGPMSGFNASGVDQAFFAGTSFKSNFICSIGYGNDERLFPRNPRLSFEESGRFA